MDKEEEMQADLKMMKEPDSWPLWPLLPMKKVADTGNPGFLLATGKPKLYLRNFLELKDIGIRTIGEVDEKIAAKEYTSFEEILDDGWIID